MVLTSAVTISQSGETADTPAALKHARSLGMEQTLTICNVSTSAMVRECKLAYITRAGVEIGVASTKAFTTQLAGLYLLTLALAQLRGRLTDVQEAEQLKALRHPPVALQAMLALEPQVMAWSEDFARMDNALFLGRGLHYPIALEGALKLKEISYIHAEAEPGHKQSSGLFVPGEGPGRWPGAPCKGPERLRVFPPSPPCTPKHPCSSQANARHSPSYGCALRLDPGRFDAPFGPGRKTLSL